MLGRTLGRLAVEVPKASTRDVSQLSQQIPPIALASIARNASRIRHICYAPIVAFHAGRRTYATAARGRTTTRKSAVKKTATKKKPAAKKKKPATKKKAALKRKTAAKKKPAKKAAPKRKVLTEEQKARRAVKERVAERQELRKKALLDEPKYSKVSQYNVYFTEISKGQKGSVTEFSKETAAKFKSLSPSELEHYNHLANDENSKREADHKKWVVKHSPAEIYEANLARARLNAMQKKYPLKTNTKKLKAIPDERQVKRPMSARLFFTKERWASGDMKNISAVEAMKLIHKEFSELSLSEKKKYQDQQTAEAERYRKEYKQTYGKEPATPRAKAAA